MYCHLLHRGIYGIVGLIADVFRVWIGGEKGRVLSNSLRRKSDFDFLSSAERCPVSARSGRLRNGRKARGIPSNPRKVVFRLKVQYRCPMLGLYHPVAEARGGARPNNAKQTIPNLIAVGIGFVFVTKCEREMKRYDRNKRRPLPSGCKRERNKRSHVKSPRFRQQEQVRSAATIRESSLRIPECPQVNMKKMTIDFMCGARMFQSPTAIDGIALLKGVFDGENIWIASQIDDTDSKL